MKRTLLVILCTAFWYGSKAQLPIVNFDTYKSWSLAVGGAMSDDSKYILYTETHVPAGNNTLRVKTSEGREVLSVVNLSQARFSADSRYLVGMLPHDSLFVFDLVTKAKRYLPAVRNYRLATWSGKERVICSGGNGALTVADFSGKSLYTAKGVKGYRINDQGSALVFWASDTSAHQANIYLVDAASGREQLIYRATAPGSLVFDKSGLQLAFVDNTRTGNQMMYFKKGMREALPLNAGSMSLSAGEYWGFTADGSRLFFNIEAAPKMKMKSANPDLEISSYQDRYSWSYYNGENMPKDRLPERQYLATIDVRTGQVLQLLKGNQTVEGGTLSSSTDDYCIVVDTASVRSAKWPDGQGRSYYLCFTKTGELVPLETNKRLPAVFWNISPGGRYAMYYDMEGRNYFCYDIVGKIKRNISGSFPAAIFDYSMLHYPHPYQFPVGYAGWLKGDRSVIIKTAFDLWEADPSGQRPPVSITAGIGEEKRTVFNFAGSAGTEWIGTDGTLLLSAFDTKTKDYGFYSLVLAKKSLRRLSMASRYVAEPYSALHPSELQICRNGYLLRSETADHSANYYFSKDLQTFKAISNVRPELNVNWLTSELHSYRDSLGNELQGVLYKPANFDPSKKYPIVFSVYEQVSNSLNAFPRPDLRGAVIMPPMMVSNGYLVFYPDVKAAPRHGSEAVTRSVIAAADHLGKYAWVDTARMGIVGHSVGGWVVNSVITHCNRFKAAIAGAGISDMVRAATDLWGDGAVKQEFLKDAAYMMDVDLPCDPDAYLRNSPILRSRYVTTPLMLLHNDHDGSVNYMQSRSFFIVLRTLQKPCWWLNYRGQGHAVNGEKHEIDYNTRVKGFFDYYLKGEPTPEWMKEHI